ncbi:MAG: VWA domain-containing protein [Candidatus Latescibacteria bacterium]|nr:VWA domain-containing protein [Candidatus Latescibacterota bacterium]
MIRFEDPGWLLLLLGVVGMVVVSLRLKKQGSVCYSDVGMLNQIGPSKWLALRHSVLGLRAVTLSLLIIGLARPQSGQRMQEVTTEGVDIVLSLDVSPSMKALDFQPKNRLEAAKDVVTEFIRERKSDRVGLVVFAAESYTQCPLTLDYAMLLNFLKDIEAGMLGDGTAIGTAIGTCVNRLRESKAKSKVVILLTDGMSNMGEIDPITAARAAAAMNVKIYTIGVGKEGRAPFKVKDAYGERTVMAETHIDEESLKEIARITGGRYYRAMDKQKLSEIYREIGELEKTKIETKEYLHTTELVGYFLLAALGLLMIELILAHTRFRSIP